MTYFDPTAPALPRKKNLPRNVYRDESHYARNKPYFVQMMAAGQMHRRGMFKTVEEAQEAAKALRQELKVFRQVTIEDLNENVVKLTSLVVNLNSLVERLLEQLLEQSSSPRDEEEDESLVAAIFEKDLSVDRVVKNARDSTKHFVDVIDEKPEWMK